MRKPSVGFLLVVGADCLPRCTEHMLYELVNKLVNKLDKRSLRAEVCGDNMGGTKPHAGKHTNQSSREADLGTGNEN